MCNYILTKGALFLLWGHMERFVFILVLPCVEIFERQLLSRHVLTHVFNTVKIRSESLSFQKNPLQRSMSWWRGRQRRRFIPCQQMNAFVPSNYSVTSLLLQIITLVLSDLGKLEWSWDFSNVYVLVLLNVDVSRGSFEVRGVSPIYFKIFSDYQAKVRCRSLALEVNIFASTLPFSRRIHLQLVYWRQLLISFNGPLTTYPYTVSQNFFKMAHQKHVFHAVNSPKIGSQYRKHSRISRASFP